MSDRFSHEIDHGMKLASGDPETTWGWGTKAGQARSKRRAQLICEGANLSTGKHILEIGCGSGLFTEALAETGASIVAVDISKDLIGLAQQRGLPAERVQFLVKPFEECDVDGPFDAVVGSSVLHHLDIEPAIRKIYSLLKPGGRISFAEPNMLNPQIMLQKNIPWLKARMGDSPDETAFFRWQMKTLLRKTGFDGIKVTALDWLHPYTPEKLIPAVTSFGNFLERFPVIREFAGSLYIYAYKPK